MNFFSEVNRPQSQSQLPVMPKPIWMNPVSPTARGVRTCTHSQPRITPLAQESAASKFRTRQPLDANNHNKYQLQK